MTVREILDDLIPLHIIIKIKHISYFCVLSLIVISVKMSIMSSLRVHHGFGGQTGRERQHSKAGCALALVSTAACSQHAHRASGILPSLPTQTVTPRAFAEQYIAQCDEKPSLATIASALQKSAYQTPRGNTNWWPAQVRELLAGHFDEHYATRPRTGSAAAP